MFGKSRQIDTETLIYRFVKSAGFRAPTALQNKAIPLTMQGRDLVVESQPGNGKTGAFIIPLLLRVKRDRDRGGAEAVVLTPSPEEVRKISAQFKRFASRAPHKPLVAAVGEEPSAKRELKILAKQPDILIGTTERIIDHLRRNNITLDLVSTAILDVPGKVSEAGFDKDVEFIYSKMPSKLQTVVYLPDLVEIAAFEPVLKRPQQLAKADWEGPGDRSTTSQNDEEESSVSNKEFKTQNDADEVRDTIEEMLRHVKEVENPDVLDYYKKTFKKRIPFHLRAYASAYLLKEFMGKEGVQTTGLQTIFVSVGKNRKVYPKDLARLFSDSLKIDSSLIGNIKILDNYSFIDVPGDQAEKAIELLNNTDYRGKRITVNYARKKKK